MECQLTINGQSITNGMSIDNNGLLNTNGLSIDYQGQLITNGMSIDNQWTIDYQCNTNQQPMDN